MFYSIEFERLEDVTQIATLTSSVVRNRLTHSYRVEQIARSIARSLPDHHGISRDVVATAALVHDIGHAPFGHTGEEALQLAVTCEHHRTFQVTSSSERKTNADSLVKTNHAVLVCRGGECLLPDGFEGNAQSFRILTLLATNHPKSDRTAGINLTRRTLRASLKYPWLRGNKSKKPRKWGVYDADLPAFRWVLEQTREGGQAEQALAPTLEATIMDLADDIAYAVHDLEDAYKAGLVPFAELSMSPPSPTFRDLIRYIKAETTDDTDGAPAPVTTTAISNILSEWKRYAPADSQPPPLDTVAEKYPHLTALHSILSTLEGPRYAGSMRSREALSSWRSTLISLFVNDVDVVDGAARIKSDELRSSLEFLKQMTWYFVIDDADLIAIRRGQVELVLTCFRTLFEQASAAWLKQPTEAGSAWRAEATHRIAKGLPVRLADYVALGKRAMDAQGDDGRYTPRQVVARAVVDYICSMTDSEVYTFSLQLSGSPTQSVPRAFG